MKILIMKQLFFTFLLFIALQPVVLSAEPDTIRGVFRFPNGNISSEGWLINGKPDGYWKTYHDNGLLKSEGNRRNFLLDSLWKFYDETGSLTLEINYREGKKDGNRITHLKDELIVETFENDIKNGPTKHYDKQGKLLKNIPFVKGLEEGLALHYDTTGNIIELTTYKRGYIIGRERINRKDAEGKPTGLWKWFFTDGKLQQEGSFKNGLKNGIFKTYDKTGNLSKIEKYIDDVKQESAEEVARLELRRDYFPDGKVKVEATYRQGVAEGIRREFDEQGQVVQSYTFSKGVLIGQGIVSNEGLRHGQWKEFYPNGKVRAEGTYTQGKRTGDWLFYYPQGSLEQQGSFNSEGKTHGSWKWYYPGGQLLRVENYRDGLRDGTMTEYTPEGLILSSGDFIDDKEEGFWIITNGLQREEGEFSEGMLNGIWKHYDQFGQLLFEGSFLEDNPHGKHLSYYADGSKREEGEYLMGRRNGSWKKWSEDGGLLLTIEYINGIEKAYDGLNIPEEDIIIAE